MIELEFEALVFVEGGKPENPKKKPRSKARSNNQLNRLMAPSGNQSQTTLVGGERSQYCAIPTPQRLITAYLPTLYPSYLLNYTFSLKSAKCLQRLLYTLPTASPVCFRKLEFLCVLFLSLSHPSSGHSQASLFHNTETQEKKLLASRVEKRNFT